MSVTLSIYSNIFHNFGAEFPFFTMSHYYYKQLHLFHMFFPDASIAPSVLHAENTCRTMFESKFSYFFSVYVAVSISECVNITNTVSGTLEIHHSNAIYAKNRSQGKSTM